MNDSTRIWEHKRGPFNIPRGRQVSNQFHRIFSVKAGMREVCVESPLEADAVYWAESNTQITSLCEQALRIYRPIGKRPYYTFDLSLNFKDGREVFYEIKPISSLKLNDEGELLPPSWDKITNSCDQIGIRCDVLTDQELNPHSKLIANYRKVLPFVRSSIEQPDEVLASELLDIIRKLKHSTIEEIIKFRPEVSEYILISQIAWLIHAGHIDSNLSNNRFSLQTHIKHIPVTATHGN